MNGKGKRRSDAPGCGPLFDALEPRMLFAGDGLTGQYFNDRFLVDPAFERVDAVVDFVYDLGSPDPTLGNDNFSVRWSGLLEAPATDTYTITARTDDGVRLYIDDVLVIDEWNDHPATDFSVDVDLTAGEPVSIVMEYYENGGGASAQLFWSTATEPRVIIPQSALSSSSGVDPTGPGTGTGLRGTYFEEITFEDQVLQRTDAAIDFDYGSGSPDSQISSDGFAIRWEGLLEARYTETYRLRTFTDDGVRLWINGELLIDDLNDHPAQSNTAFVDLVAGEKVNIRMDYYENGGGAVAQLFWSSVSQAEQIIPTSQLYLPDAVEPPVGDGTGLRGQYFDGRSFETLVLERLDPEVSFDFGVGSPDPLLPDNNFSVRWEGQIEARYTESYTLSTISDDGVRLYLDGELLIDQWNDHPASEHSTTVELVAGEKVDIVIEYYENGGGASMKLFWESISQARQIVPDAQLYPAELTPENLPPIARDDNFAVEIDSPGADLDVLVNDTDPDNDAIVITQVFEAAHGTVETDGVTITYTPEPGYLGPDTFLYEITDTNDTVATARVDINVFQPNRPPTLIDDTLTLEQDSGSADIAVLENDSDLDGDSLSVWGVTQGSNGSVSLSGDLITYTPSAGFSGSDSFLYTVTDGEEFATATVTVNVTPVNRGTIGLASDTYNVQETDEFVIVSIQRTGGADGRVDADYNVTAGTATDGEDYIATSGTVVFEDGQTVANILINLIDDIDVEGEETFGVSLDRVGGGVALGAPRTALIYINDNELPTVDLGNGLLGQYYDNIDFTDLVVERTDPTIDYEWETGSPDAAIGSNTFSVRWSGQIKAEFSETYTFRTLSDDGIRLVVNGVTLVDALVNQGPTSYTGSIDLVAGEKVDIELTYYEDSGGAVAKLFWSSASVAEEIVPTVALFSEPADPLGSLPTLGSEVLVTGLSQPTAIDFAPDGTMFILQKNGQIRLFKDGVLQATPFVDHTAAVNNVRDRGALGLALHPDFPNTPYVYMAYTYDPPETIGQAGLAAPDQAGNRGARVSRFTADVSTGYTTAVAGSEVVILGTNSTWDNIVGPDQDSTGNFDLDPSGFDENGDPVRDFIATDSQSHTIGALDFGLDGMLYVSTGDGTSYGSVDPRTTRVQSIDNLSGKILRVDPITGQGPSDNPFYDGDPDSNRSKVFSYGLRNPYRNTINPFTGEIYIGDVGWNQWEEINVASGGENFGWPYYEGGDGDSLEQVTGYQNLSEAQAFYASNPDVTAPFWSKSHVDGARAIILGDFNTGSIYAGYEKALFFLDYQKPTIQAIIFNEDGTYQREVTALATPGNVVEMSMGIDGYMYWVDLDGRVGRLTFPSM